MNRTVVELNKEAERYVATWTGRASEEDFYSAEGVTVETIEVRRYCGGVSAPAFEASLALVPSHDRMAYRLVLQRLLVRQARAKLPCGGKTLDVVIAVKLDGLQVVKGTEAHSVTFADVSLPVTGVELGREFTPSADRPVASQWFPGLPRSTDIAGKIAGTGNFDLVVTVTETDDFGKRVKAVADLLDNNKASVKKWLTP